uniref:DUF229 domain-containing protein n=1 Tax=Toxocara canis TaxID=6265 RepID=A0A183TVX8_TOXCA
LDGLWTPWGRDRTKGDIEKIIERKAGKEFLGMETTRSEVLINRQLAHEFDRVKYKFFRRANGSDSSLMYENWMEFPQSGELDLQGFNGVIVRGRIQKRQEYSDVHASVTPLYRVPSSKQPLIGEAKRRSVLIVGIDSVSRSNVIRNLPLSYRYLTEEIGGWDFRGYSKIDDNTFPNMLAVLTGHKVAVDYKELHENVQTSFVDHWPFIWTNFSKAGYTTLLAEEQPGIFSYKARGFKRAPTDVYLRPYGHVLMEMPLYRSSSHFCFGNTPEAQLLLETVRRFMEVQADEKLPYFAFSFLWKLSHDFTSYIERLDAILARWLQEIHVAGLLNNTVLMVMSDHGNRFDEIRKTLIGRYEERMPFLFVHLPESLTGEHAITEAMNTNIWRMSTQFDVYETLVDIVQNTYGTERQTLFNRGISLFREIPLSRTCDDLIIAEHFCVCQVEETISVESEEAIRSAKALIEKINDELKVVSLQCSEVQENNRWHFKHYLSDKNVTHLVSFIRLTVLTQPNSALFEAVVQITQPDPQRSFYTARTTSNSISRVNAYGTAADCISATHRPLEKYCTCRKKASRYQSFNREMTAEATE